MNDLTLRAESAIARLLELDASEAEFHEAIQIVDRVAEIARQLKAKVELAAIEWIKKHGPVSLNETRYFVGPNKKVKCNSPYTTLLKCMEEAGGDLDRIGTLLSSDSLKPGACRELLGEEEFNRQFTTTVVDDLKTGKPSARLQKLNTAFLPNKPQAPETQQHEA